MSGRSEPTLAASGARTDSLEGSTVGAGRFVVRSELGRGGMGEVYRAFDRQRGHEVALKVIAARYVGRAERERRFRNEADYAQRVKAHPNVLSVVDVGVLDDCGRRLFMTMEPVSGPTLAMELASSRRLPMDQALSWAHQIASGLEAIHAAGIVHRDLTPSNILIQAGTNVAKIFDFGLAGELDAPASGHGSRLTLLGEVPGTHGYMAPEQAILAAPAASMDVHAYGAVLTEMLVGHNPFAHLDREEYITWQQSSREEVPSIKRWGLVLPAGLADLIDDCLRRDPKERPQNGAQLRARLQQIVPVSSTVSKPEPAFVPEPLPLPNDPAEDELEDADTIRGEPIDAPARRLWLAGVMLAALLVVTGVAVGWWLATTLRSSSEARGPETIDEVEPGDDATASNAVVGPVIEPAPVVGSPPIERPAATEASTSTSGAAESEPRPTSTGTGTGDGTPTSPASEATSSDPVSVPASSAVSCETRRQRAHDAAQRKLWKKVLASTQSGRCWPDDLERQRLRVRGLAETGQYAACLRLAADSGDPDVVRWRVRCEEGLWKPGP